MRCGMVGGEFNRNPADIVGLVQFINIAHNVSFWLGGL
jgi:hypothetical protein